MWEKYLVARLSPKASQVLLALLLARNSESAFTQAEFANRTGLVGWSIPPALSELEDQGLVRIVSQDDQLMQVRLIHPEEYVQHETKTTVEEVVHPPHGLPAGAPVPSLLGAPVPEASGSDGGGSTEADGTEARLIARCREADARGDRGAKLAALVDTWELAFPLDEYPYQRLTLSGAHRLLAGRRSVEEVGQAILDAPATAIERIESPLAYVEAILRKREERKRDEPESPINDELRELTKKGRQQYERTKDGWTGY